MQISADNSIWFIVDCLLIVLLVVLLAATATANATTTAVSQLVSGRDARVFRPTFEHANWPLIEFWLRFWLSISRPNCRD